MYRLLALLAVPGGLAVAQEKTATPQGPPPRFMVVGQVQRDQGLLMLNDYMQVAETRVRREVVEKGGQKIVVEVPETVYRTVVRQTAWHLKHVQVFTSQGRKLVGEDGLRRLTAGRTILVTEEAEGVDPAYRALLAPDALVVILPRPGGPQKLE